MLFVGILRIGVSKRQLALNYLKTCAKSCDLDGEFRPGICTDSCLFRAVRTSSCVTISWRRWTGVLPGQLEPFGCTSIQLDWDVETGDQPFWAPGPSLSVGFSRSRCTWSWPTEPPAPQGAEKRREKHVGGFQRGHGVQRRPSSRGFALERPTWLWWSKIG